MSHQCPDCGMTCHCNGDIDDCCFDFDENVNNCIHCVEDDLTKSMDELFK